MTKAEAIAMLKRIQEPEAWEPQINQAAFEALDMAIEALSQESSEDVISRQAAIDALSQYPFEKVVNCVSIIEELPSAQPEQRWIPCSERLPNIKNRIEKYLVTLKSGTISIAMFVECDGEHWWNHYDDVVAWMPLPEPYREERTEE